MTNWESETTLASAPPSVRYRRSPYPNQQVRCNVPAARRIHSACTTYWVNTMLHHSSGTHPGAEIVRLLWSLRRVQRYFRPLRRRSKSPRRPLVPEYASLGIFPCRIEEIVLFCKHRSQLEKKDLATS